MTINSHQLGPADVIWPVPQPIRLCVLLPNLGFKPQLIHTINVNETLHWRTDNIDFAGLRSGFRLQALVECE